MKSQPSPEQNQRVSSRVQKTPAHPVRPEDAGTESFGCAFCGRVFIERATPDFIRSFGDFFCGNCDKWSRPEGAEPLPEATA